MGRRKGRPLGDRTGSSPEKQFLKKHCFLWICLDCDTRELPEVQDEQRVFLGLINIREAGAKGSFFEVIYSGASQVNEIPTGNLLTWRIKAPTSQREGNS